MAYPSLPDTRSQFQPDRDDGSTIVIEESGLSSLMVSKASPSKTALIDTAMAQLFGGALALRHSDPATMRPKSQASMTNALEPSDWRSRDAWGGFLVEARQRASGSGHAQDVETIELQLASRSMQSHRSASPGHGAPRNIRQEDSRPVARMVHSPELTSSDAAAQKDKALVRVSASAVEVRAVEMIAPVSPVSAAPDGEGPGEAMSVAGQIVGSVFIDGDGDGQPGRGDTRLEGQAIYLTPLQPDVPRLVHRSVSFGQYAFEGVKPGAYLLSVSIGWEDVSVPVKIEQGSLGQRIDIAVPPEIAWPDPIGIALAGGIEAEG
ncbi:hypothetical protein [Henriciella barbarensis]|nr:hypothetical protein [Henriciella barbarensis]